MNEKLVIKHVDKGVAVTPLSTTTYLKTTRHYFFTNALAIKTATPKATITTMCSECKKL